MSSPFAGLNAIFERFLNDLAGERPNGNEQDVPNLHWKPYAYPVRLKDVIQIDGNWAGLEEEVRKEATALIERIRPLLAIPHQMWFAGFSHDPSQRGAVVGIVRLRVNEPWNPWEGYLIEMPKKAGRMYTGHWTDVS